MLNSFDRWAEGLAVLLVYPPWMWLAVRTRDALQFLSRRAVPYSVRTIWLVKFLALIVGAGGVLGVSLQVGLHWIIGVLLSGAVVFFALKEKVEGIVPPKPSQKAAAYTASWQDYRLLRKRALGLVLGFFVLFIAIGTVGAILESQLSHFGQVAFFAVTLIAALWVSVLTCLAQWMLVRWPCPRCGCAFRGLWKPWLPKKCAYCELPRWAEKPAESLDH
jgi:hypothetical protein